MCVKASLKANHAVIPPVATYHTHCINVVTVLNHLDVERYKFGPDQQNA